MITVLGEPAVDIYLEGSVHRLSPEAPIPVINIQPDSAGTRHPGMAANVASLLRSYNHTVYYNGDHRNDPIPFERIRYVDSASGYHLLRVDIDRGIEPVEYAYLDKALNQSETVVISDYNKGYLPLDRLEYIAEACRDMGILSVLDTKKSITPELARRFTYTKVNRKEQQLDLDEANVVMTLGAEGARFRGIIYAPDKVVHIRNVTGAGDTFLAAFVHYVLHKPPTEAVVLAVNAASHSVQFKGTSQHE